MAKRGPTKAEQQASWLWWMVFSPTRVYAIFAEDIGAAKSEVLKTAGFIGKSYLARDWQVRVAQPEELERHLRTTTSREQRTIDDDVKTQRERLEKRGWLA